MYYRFKNEAIGDPGKWFRVKATEFYSDPLMQAYLRKEFIEIKEENTPSPKQKKQRQLAWELAQLKSMEHALFKIEQNRIISNYVFEGFQLAKENIRKIIWDWKNKINNL